MAEFCLDCWNKMEHTHYTEREVVLTKGPDLCEGCAQWRRVIVGMREHPALYDLKRLFFRKKHK